MKDVFAIYESKGEGSERSRWVRVGVAFENKDGSLNVLLDAVPLTGRLQIRARQPAAGSGQGQGREQGRGLGSCEAGAPQNAEGAEQG